MLDELKKYFEETPLDEFEKDWNQTKGDEKKSPTLSEFMDFWEWGRTLCFESVPLEDLENLNNYKKDFVETGSFFCLIFDLWNRMNNQNFHL